MSRRILLLMGMAPEPRMFDRMRSSLPAARVVDWIVPSRNEPVDRYAARLAALHAGDDRPLVVGVSFGGIVAREFAPRVNATACVLISSIRGPEELTPLARPLRYAPGWSIDAALRMAGIVATYVPLGVRSGGTTRVAKLVGAQGDWYRWATSAVLRWRPSPEMERTPVVQIHGDRDTIFPVARTRPDVTIAGGGHFLLATHGDFLAAELHRLGCAAQ